MNETLLFTIITLCALGAVAAIVLYYVAQKFKVYEDPRIDETEKMLPGANCGGCGYPGCRGFADALVANDDIDSLFCPVGGAETMKKIATYLGKAAAEKEPQIAVIKCKGDCENRPKTNIYDGEKSCVVAASLYGGDSACSYGCLGLGDCVNVCSFGAIKIDTVSGLPYVDEELCTACGKCVSACPKGVIELRKKGPKGRRVYIGCSNKDKGALARKACKVACIGCGKCVKTCPFDAITLENNLAYIDASKCKLCRKCVLECPTKAIVEINFPPRPAPKPKVEATEVKSAEPKAEPKVEPKTETKSTIEAQTTTEPKAKAE